MYNEEFKKVLAKYKSQGEGVVDIAVGSGGVDKVFHEKEFFWCGFNTFVIDRDPKNKPLIKQLEDDGATVERFHNWFGYKGKWTGYEVRLSNNNDGNGYYTIEEEALGNISKHLNSLGYSTQVYSRLD